MATLFSILWLIVGILLQVLLFDHLSLWGGVVLFYVYMLSRMPVETKRIVQILTGFAAGAVVDVFCNTPGMHALAAGTLMFMRSPILHLLVERDDFKAGVPCLRTMGMPAFSRYLLTLTILHASILYVSEAFTVFHFWILLAKIVVSVVLTCLVAIVVELYIQNK